MSRDPASSSTSTKNAALVEVAAAAASANDPVWFAGWLSSLWSGNDENDDGFPTQSSSSSNASSEEDFSSLHGQAVNGTIGSDASEDGFPLHSSSSSSNASSEEDISSSREETDNKTFAARRCFSGKRRDTKLLAVAIIVVSILVVSHTVGLGLGALIGVMGKHKGTTHQSEDEEGDKGVKPQGGDNTPQGGDNTPQGGDNTPQGGDNTPQGGDNTPQGGDNTPQGGDDTPQAEDNTPQAEDEGGRLSRWKFILGDANEFLIDSTEEWNEVTVPHSWNVKDGQDGGTYYRGPAWYQRQLDITNYRPGKRYFLRFQAVGTVAEVYFDKHKVTQHKGGYTAFATEITEWINDNGIYDVRVKADNSYREDVAPLSGDFTIAGGMHRPVDLLVKNQVCLSPLDDASPGVRIFQEGVSAETASLRVNVLLDNGMRDTQSTRVVISLKDAASKTVASDTMETTVLAGSIHPIDSILTFEDPHLWQSIEDPYLHTLHVEVHHENKLTDTFTKSVGFRSVSIEPESGFYLNGKPFPLRGVNMHHDHQDMGAALTDEQIRKDFALVQELGASSVRLAHYPHSALSHEICDELGLLVWAEIPLVNEMKDSPEFALNARQQWLEMVKQLGNYHSVYTWGVTNEMFQKETDDPFDLLIGLNEFAKELDPSRFTIQATNRNRRDLNTITDTFGINYYPGWYGTDPHSMSRGMTRFNNGSGSRGLAIAEYGAGGSILHQSQVLGRVEPKGKWHPEQWQAFLHEAQYIHIVSYKPAWASYIWLMFDFSSDSRNEGDRPGVNDKGLITHDHTTKKDAFYFYHANWRKDTLVLHLCSKRHNIRTEKSTSVKVYSNLPEVELFVNDERVGTQRPNDFAIAMFDFVELNLGDNKILVRDTHSKLSASDSVVWTYDPNAQVLTEETSSLIVEGMFTASDAEFGNGPSNAFDDNPDSRWATKKTERGAWISRELDDEQTVSGLSILWYKSTIRSYEFKVEASIDGNTWRLAHAGTSSKMESAETYIFRQPEEARHIRIICFGSDINEWSTIREIVLQTEKDHV